MRKIKFIVDFSDKSKGYVWETCESMLASQLVNIEKVAVYIDEQESEEKPKKAIKK